VSIPAGDSVVLWVKFISHGHSEEARRRWPSNRVHYHLGGIGELVAKVIDAAKAS
jgi:hypothetical protein